MESTEYAKTCPFEACMTKSQKRTAHLLAANGVPKHPAACLALLIDGELTARDLEDNTRLRQPEVSIATQYLRERGWVVVTKNPCPGKRRPFHSYGLAVPFADIVREISVARTMELRRELDALEELEAVA